MEFNKKVRIETEPGPGGTGPQSTTAEEPLPKSFRTRVRSLVPLARYTHFGLFAAASILFVILSITAPFFLTIHNLLNLLQQVSFVGIIAFGMTLVIIGGEIDISVGSAIAFASAMLGVMHLNWGLPIAVSAVAVVALGAVVGLSIGLIRARLGIPSFIVSLAYFTGLSGTALLISAAQPKPLGSQPFQFLGNGTLGGIPFPVIVMVGLFLLFWFIATRTVFGRSVYAVGGNAEAARLSGLPVFRIRVVLFGITGGLAALSGVMFSAQIGSADPTLGVGAEFDVIAAVIVGGTALFGGIGTMGGTLLGILLIGMIQNGMVLLGVSPYAQGLARGIIIILAMIVSTLRARGQFRRRLAWLFGRWSKELLAEKVDE